MKSRLVLLLLLLSFASQAKATDWFVLKSATGSNNGTSWTNAWTEMNKVNLSSVACGDRIWLGFGNYTTGLSLNKTCTAASPITLQSVIASDAGVPTNAVGKATLPSVTLAAGSYINMNGRKGSPTTNDFGIAVVCTSSSGCNAFSGATSGSISNITISYVEMFGPPCVLTENCGGGGTGGFNVAPSTNKVTSVTLDHNWIHRWGEALRASNWTNVIIQNSDIDTTHNDGPQHEDIMYSYPNTNLTMRYNRIWGSPNDGIFFEFGGTTNFQFYGNVYYHSGASEITWKQGSNYGTQWIYNNVFENDGTFGDYQPAWIACNGPISGGEVANNVFMNVNIQGSCPNVNHNISVNVATGTTYFVNISPSNPPIADFHLTSAGMAALSGGKTLAAPYNMDADGNIRGSNGTWTIGAFQAGGTPPPPTAPVITSQPSSQSVVAPNTATFNVGASGTASLTYQWQKNTTNISGATSSSYTTPATTTADTGSNFRVVVSNSQGSATSNSATLTVTSAPPVCPTCPTVGQTINVVASMNVNVRSTAVASTNPNNWGPIIGTEAPGNLGTVVQNAQPADGTFFWIKVQFNDGLLGYTGSNGIAVTTTPPTQDMTTICSFSTPTVWTCNSTLQNVPSGQAIKSVTTTGTLSNTTTGTKP